MDPERLKKCFKPLLIESDIESQIEPLLCMIMVKIELRGKLKIESPIEIFCLAYLF